MTPLKYLAQINPSTPEFDRLSPETEICFVPLEAVWRPGVDASQRRTKESVATGYTRFLEGDIVLPKITPTFQADRTTIVAGVEGRVAAGTTELHVVRVGPDADVRYVRYLLSSRPFLHGGTAEMVGVAGQKRVPDSWLRQFPVRVERLSAQKAIADYLDTETARIDALIAKKRELVEAVGQRVMATIDESVWDGVTQRAALRRVAVFVDYRGATPTKSAAGVPLITATHVKAGRLNLALDPQFLMADDYEIWMRRGFPRRGDVLITTEAPLGEVAQIEDEEVALAQRLILLKADRRRMEPDYLAFALRSTRFQSLLWANATGSTALGIKADRLKALEIPLPTLERQRAVARSLRERTNTQSRLIERLTTQLKSLGEHRQALITAAVTGELRIPGAA